ncbi:MAG: hypothetical protein EPN86_02935 [Nanoarchaeota archaeon]|nr:MAG: hypothetical protein EPN86_02935 [Nanoarchaeota archaeon]
MTNSRLSLDEALEFGAKLREDEEAFREVIPKNVASKDIDFLLFAHGQASPIMYRYFTAFDGLRRPYVLIRHPYVTVSAEDKRAMIADNLHFYEAQLDGFRNCPQFESDEVADNFRDAFLSGNIEYLKSVIFHYRENGGSAYLIGCTSTDSKVDVKALGKAFGLTKSPRKSMRPATIEEIAENFSVRPQMEVPPAIGMISPFLIENKSLRGVHYDMAVASQFLRDPERLLELPLSRRHSLVLRGEDFLIITYALDYAGKVRPGVKEMHFK